MDDADDEDEEEFSEAEINDSVTDKQCPCGDTRRKILKPRGGVGAWKATFGSPKRQVISMPVWDYDGNLVSRGFEWQDCPNCRSKRTPSADKCYACDRAGLPTEQHHVLGRGNMDPPPWTENQAEAERQAVEAEIAKKPILVWSERKHEASVKRQRVEARIAAQRLRLPETVPLCISCHLLVTLMTKPRRYIDVVDGVPVGGSPSPHYPPAEERKHVLGWVREEAKGVFRTAPKLNLAVARRRAKAAKLRVAVDSAHKAELAAAEKALAEKVKQSEAADRQAADQVYRDSMQRPISAESISRWLAGEPMMTEPSTAWRRLSPSEQVGVGRS